MKTALKATVLVVSLALASVSYAKGSRGGGGPHYGGGKHTTSHGGSYKGGSGSSHKGGSYRNSKTGNQYGKHKP